MALLNASRLQKRQIAFDALLNPYSIRHQRNQSALIDRDYQD